jgi:two-component system, OmpR family, KDP operon response regulator KdpE
MAKAAEPGGERTRGDDLVALIVSTRPYAAIDLVPMLLRHRISSIERGRADALTFAQHLQPDFVIAVVDPSRIEDLDLVRNLSRASNAMLLVLAPSSEVLAAALRAGADLYVRDGDGQESLEAQISAMRRRTLSTLRPEADDIVGGGPIRLSRASRRCWAGDQMIALTNMEFSLLLALVDNQGRVLSPLQAARMSTGREPSESEAAQTVKVYVRRLRQKLEEAGCPASLIINVRGRGYIFDPGSRASTATAL